jgi:hypothetical protein
MKEDLVQTMESLDFYKTKLSDTLTFKEKERLMNRIYDYRCKHYPLPDDNPISEFPELEKHWEKDFFTGLELVIIESELYEEVRCIKRFKPFKRYAEATPLNREKLNSIRSLYYAYKKSGFTPEKIALEFYRSVGLVFRGHKLEDLDLKYIEFKR